MNRLLIGPAHDHLGVSGKSPNRPTVTRVEARGWQMHYSQGSNEGSVRWQRVARVWTDVWDCDEEWSEQCVGVCRECLSLSAGNFLPIFWRYTYSLQLLPFIIYSTTSSQGQPSIQFHTRLHWVLEYQIFAFLPPSPSCSPKPGNRLFLDIDITDIFRISQSLKVIAY